MRHYRNYKVPKTYNWNYKISGNFKNKALENITFGPVRSNVQSLHSTVPPHFTPRLLIIQHIHFHPKAYITMKSHQHGYVGYTAITLYI
jgi:hypothetical protein